jgi:heat shock protein HspQ
LLIQNEKVNLSSAPDFIMTGRRRCGTWPFTHYENQDRPVHMYVAQVYLGNDQGDQIIEFVKISPKYIFEKINA